MKEIFLSFNPKYYKTVLYGIKKYEYRKLYCKEETIAYLYLSGKIKKVIGILELGKPIRLDLTRNNYLKYPDTLNRIDTYINNRDINAIPIKSLQLFNSPITLNDIRKEIPSFMPPQMYYILDNQPKLKEILKREPINKPIFIHEHNGIYYDNLAKSVKELEQEEEFIKIDKERRIIL